MIAKELRMDYDIDIKLLTPGYSDTTVRSFGHYYYYYY